MPNTIHAARLLVQRRVAAEAVLGTFNHIVIDVDVVVPKWFFLRRLIMMGDAWENNMPTFYQVQISALERVALERLLEEITR